MTFLAYFFFNFDFSKFENSKIVNGGGIILNGNGRNENQKNGNEGGALLCIKEYVYVLHSIEYILSRPSLRRP